MADTLRGIRGASGPLVNMDSDAPRLRLGRSCVRGACDGSTVPGLPQMLASASQPPNLRRGNARARCGLCKHFGRGECMKYGVAVKPTALCDSFQSNKEKKS